jgi:hypothetical protein
MRIESPNTVRLTDREQNAKHHFDFLLDEGHSSVDALKDTQREFPRLEPKFCRWLLGAKVS